MHHGAVARHRRFVNLIRRDPLLAADAFDQFVQRAYHQPLQLLQAIALAGIDDAADHVLAALDLPVIVRGLLDYVPGDQIHQVDDVAGSANVDGHPPVLIAAVRRQHVHQAGRPLGPVPGVLFNHHRHVPIVGAQGLGQLLQHR